MKRFYLNAALLALFFGIVAEWFSLPALDSTNQSNIFLGLKSIGYPKAYCLWFHSWPERLLGHLANPDPNSDNSYSFLFYIVATLQWTLLFYLLFLVVRFFCRQTNPKVLKAALTVTLALLLMTLHYKLHSDFSDFPRMRTDIELLADKAGGLRAEKDFNSGMLRKFIFSGTNSIEKYTGTNSGPFQIWVSHYSSAPYDVSDSALQCELYEYNYVMQKKYHASLKQANAPAMH